MANRPLLRRRSLLGAAIESTKGTAETVSAPMAGTIVYNAEMVPEDLFEGGEAEPEMGSSGQIQRRLGPKMGRLSFETELIPSDLFSSLIQGCGFNVAAGVSTIQMAYDSQKTLTFVLWEDGMKKTLRGAAGTVRIRVDQTAGRMVAAWSFMGIWVGTADEALPSFTPVVTRGYRAAGVTATLGGTAIPQFNTFELDLGADVQRREDPAIAEGILCYSVVDINPTLTIDAESRLVADLDQFGIHAAGTTQALVLTLASSTGATFKIDAPAAQRVDVGAGDRGKKRITPLTLQLCVTARDNQVQFTETAAP